jgi:hypothetical protein
MLAVFGDAALLRAALLFEAVLAEAQVAEGLIPLEAGEAIVAACVELPDVEDLAEAAAHAGTLAIPLVQILRRRVAARHGDAVAALVHKGATSQDLADTALMLQAKAGAALIRDEAVTALAEALATLAQTHAATPMLGRTLLQAALPITFGLKVAGWLQGVDEALMFVSTPRRPPPCACSSVARPDRWRAGRQGRRHRRASWPRAWACPCPPRPGTPSAARSPASPAPWPSWSARSARSPRDISPCWPRPRSPKRSSPRSTAAAARRP